MLRWICIVLIIANVVVASLWFTELKSLFFGVQPDITEVDDSSLDKEPIEQLEIKSQSVAQVTTEEQMCVELRGFSDQKSLSSIKQWLKKKGLFARERTRVVVTEQVYRVYIGGFSSQQEVQKSMRLLIQQSKSFEGSVIFQHAPADWRISLNVFSTEGQANNYLSAIKKKHGDLNADVAVQTKSNEELYLIMTETTAAKFLQDYQNYAQWHQMLLREGVSVDQCIAKLVP